MKTIEIDSSKCTGCMACILACSLAQRESFSYNNAVMKILKDEARAVFQLYQCSNCDDMKCIEACPFDAISLEEEWGIPVINYEKCTSCGICAKECNYGIIKIHDESKRVYKCNFCNGSPACVLSCSSGAIKVNDIDIKEGK